MHAHYILHASGRWNRPAEYGCLYTSLSREGAEAEHRKYLKRAGLTRTRAARARDLVSIDVEVEPALDLSNRNVRRRLGIEIPDITSDSEEGIETCRAIADLARAEGYRAILAPSAAAAGERVLAIYLEGPPSGLRLREGEERTRLVPGARERG